MTSPSFTFVLAFLLFSLLFLSNTYRVWFHADQYYEEVRASLARMSSAFPFKGLFARGMDNKERWILRQKIFSALGFLAVLAMNVLMVWEWLDG
jgi:hypothetical protein